MGKFSKPASQDAGRAMPFPAGTNSDSSTSRPPSCPTIENYIQDEVLDLSYRALVAYQFGKP